MLFIWLVLLQLALFGTLVFFLRGILSKNVSSATEHLHALNQDYTQKIEEAKKHQADADRYYDETVLRAKTDAEKTKVQILKEAQASHDTTVNEARKQSAEILAQANRARDEILKEVEKHIDGRAVEKACELVQEVLPGHIGEDLHHRWVKEILKGGLENLSRLNIPDRLDVVHIVSAYPLAKADRAALETKLREALVKDVRFDERSDATLLAGFMITIGSVVIDGSFRHKLKEAVRDAQHAS